MERPSGQESPAVGAPPLRGACRPWRRRLDWGRVEPAAAALLLRGRQRPFALIGRWAGGGALLGSDPVAVAAPEDDPFATVERQPRLDAAPPPPPDAGPPVVGGGWFGYLGYRAGRRIEALDAGPGAVRPLPEFQLAFYDHLLRLDPEGRWWFEALISDGRESAIEARVAELLALRPDPAAPAPRPRPFRTAPWRSTPNPAGHGLAVAACRERIRAGDLFQANICLRLSSRIEGDPLDLFATAAPRLDPDRAAYLAGPWGALASLSPELFLERHGRRVRSAPIKGTRPRPAADPAEAERLRRELLASDKDRAENRMILDLVRNDLGRVCAYGTIAVGAAVQARAHTGVWHLVSEVSGDLHESRGDRELLRATFPPASVTGAPKIAAQDVIAELESTAREAYTGAIGFVSPLAGLEMSVTIRTFEFSGSQAWLGLGGGIVADSDPVEEAAECRTKATPLLRAIGAEYAPAPAADRSATDTGSGAWPAAAPYRRGPRPVPRPDPAHGVFETLLVEGGRAAHLDRHLARVGASLAALYGARPPADLRSRVEAAAAELALPSRLRLDLRPADPGRLAATDPGPPEGPPLRLAIQSRPIEPRPAVTLRPVTVPGGIGPHKWADRRLIESLAELTAPDIPLICDLDGHVLEASYANVFVELEHGSLITPPLDGRLLPGITRARLLADPAALLGRPASVRERPIRLAELPAAVAIYLTSSISGPVPATLASPERSRPAAA